MVLRTRLRRTIATVLATVAIGAVGGAGATSLGGAATLTMLSTNATLTPGAPTVVACDDFSRPAATGAALNGRPVQQPGACGAVTWTVHTGTWTISSGQLSASTGGATATVSAGQTDESAQATLLNMNATGRVAGVAIDHTGGSRTFLAAVLSGGNQLLLRLSNAGTLSTLASAAVTPAASAVLRITRNTGVVTVSLDGVTKISFALTAAQVTTLGSGVRTGFYWNGGTAVRFTNLLVTTPAAP